MKRTGVLWSAGGIEDQPYLTLLAVMTAMEREAMWEKINDANQRRAQDQQTGPPGFRR